MWTMPFITKQQFEAHVRSTIEKYASTFEPVDIKRFNKNIIDPVKLIFDKTISGVTWEDAIRSEVVRQRDKSANNDIGYFHQGIFAYIANCIVPKEGWDVIYKCARGVQLSDGDTVHTVYVEMKNKHNTMNSSSAGKTYMNMQNQLIRDDDCACCLVEVIAKKSQNIPWSPINDGKKITHKRIRRVSIDQFYSLVTGVEDAFYRVCMELPSTIKRIVAANSKLSTPKDTVLDELKTIAKTQKLGSNELAWSLAIYMLGFSTYTGFNQHTQK